MGGFSWPYRDIMPVAIEWSVCAWSVCEWSVCAWSVCEVMKCGADSEGWFDI